MSNLPFASLARGAYPVSPQPLATPVSVLILADSETARSRYRQWLQSHGNQSYRLIMADTLEAGQALWRTECPHLALVDLGLSAGQGLRFVAALAADGLAAPLPVIVLAPAGHEPMTLQALKLGAADFLEAASLSPASLGQAVQLVCHRQSQQGQVAQLQSQLQRSQQQIAMLADISYQVCQRLDFVSLANRVVQAVNTLLATDRTVVYQFGSAPPGTVVAECASADWLSCLQAAPQDTGFLGSSIDAYQADAVSTIPDIDAAGFTDAQLAQFEAFQVRASLAVPILLPHDPGDTRWGLLIAHQCSAPRHWTQADSQLLQQLSVQLAIAIPPGNPDPVLPAVKTAGRVSGALCVWDVAGRAQHITCVANQLLTCGNVQEILASAIAEIRFLLACDRTVIYQLHGSTLNGTVVAESLAGVGRSLLHQELSDPGFPRDWLEPFQQGQVRVIHDIEAESLSQCHRERFREAEMRSQLMVPIMIEAQLWGLIIASYRDTPYRWQPDDMDIAQQLSVYLAIALNQGMTHERLLDELEKRQMIENFLFESEQRYASLAAAAPVGIYRTNAAGNCTYANDYYFQLTGLTSDADVTDRWRQRLHPEDRDRVVTAWAQSIQKGCPLQLEYRFLDPDGHLIWVYEQAAVERDMQGQVIGLVSTLTNITQHKQTEQALQEAQQRYRMATRAAKVGIWEWNLKTHEFYLDPNIKALLGYSDAEIPNDLKVWTAHIHPEDTEATMAAVQDYLAGKTSEYVCEHRMLHKDGAIIWILVRGQLLRDSQGNPERLLGTDTDITERKVTELALQQSEAHQRALVSALPDLMMRMNRAGVHLECITNPNFQLVGEPDIILGASIFEVMPLAVAQERIHYIHQALDSGSMQMYEQEFCLAGNLVIEEVRVVPYTDDEVLLLVRDIRDRRQAEQALKKSEAKSRALLAAIPDLMLRIDANGVYREIVANNQSLNFFPPDFSPVGHQIADLLPADLAVRHRHYIQQALQTGELQVYEQQISVGEYQCDEEVRVAKSGDDEVLLIIRDITERKQFEAALRQSEERFRSLFESTPQIAVQGYRLDRRVIYWNEASEKFYGFTKAEAIGQQLEDLIIPPETKDPWIEDMRSWVRSGQSLPAGELTLLRKDGTRIAVFSSHIMLTSPDGEPEFYCVEIDLSDRKRIEQQLHELNQSLEAKVEARTLELQEREQFLQTVLDTFPLSVFWKDQHSVYLGCNRNFLQQASFTADVELQGKTDYDLPWSTAEAESFRSDDQQVMASNIPKLGIIETQRQADGSQIWLETNKLPLYDLTGKVVGVLGTFQDITARYQAELALRESEARWQFALEGQGDGVWDWNIQTNKVFFSPQWKALLGYSGTEISNRLDECTSRIHPEDMARVQEDLQRHFRGEVPVYQNEHRVRCKDGSYRWTLNRGKVIAKTPDGAPLRLIGTLSDITDRKRAEIALQNLVAGTATTTGEDFFPALVKHLAAALNVSHAIVARRVGDRLEALAFWSHGTLQSNSAYAIAGTPCECTLRDGIYYCLQSVQQAFPADANLVTLQAESYLGIALKNSQGETIGGLCILHRQPLRDRERAEQILQVFAARAGAELERQRTTAALEQLNRSLETKVEERTAALKAREAQLQTSNRELEAFAYSVSHDLRAPLRAISGFSEALIEDYGTAFDAEAELYFTRIQKNILRMEQLIADLLTLSRVARATIRLRRVNLSALAEELIHDLQAAEPERQVEVEILPDITVFADETLMRVVLSNLLQNAWKFTSRRTTARIEFGTTDREGQRIYWIRDDGAGFDMTYARKLFGVFQRLHSAHEFAGTGIGLATVQRAIHRHGGTIWAEGAVEQGAAFYFTVPGAAVSPNLSVSHDSFA